MTIESSETSAMMSSTAADLDALVAGTELYGRRVVTTAARIQWYGDGMLSAASGVIRKVGSNIHTDPDYAKQQGMSDAIADGMICTNWLSTMMTEIFGTHYLETGELRAKFIRPIPAGMEIQLRARVERIEQIDERSRDVVLTVWCEDSEGSLRTEGDARVRVIAGS